MLKCNWATWFSGYSRISLSMTKHQVLSVRSRQDSSIWLEEGTWCTELGNTAEPGCQKLTMRCASKKQCLHGAELLCCSHSATV